MTVRELIERLNVQDPEAVVLVPEVQFDGEWDFGTLEDVQPGTHEDLYIPEGETYLKTRDVPAVKLIP